MLLLGVMIYFCRTGASGASAAGVQPLRSLFMSGRGERDDVSGVSLVSRTIGAATYFG